MKLRVEKSGEDYLLLGTSAGIHPLLGDCLLEQRTIIVSRSKSLREIRFHYHALCAVLGHSYTSVGHTDVNSLTSK